MVHLGVGRAAVRRFFEWSTPINTKGYGYCTVKQRKRKGGTFFQELPSRRKGRKELILTDLVIKNWKGRTVLRHDYIRLHPRGSDNNQSFLGTRNQLVHPIQATLFYVVLCHTDCNL